MVALDDGGGGAEVFDAGVGAGAQEDSVDLDRLDGGAGLEAHVLEGAGVGLFVGLGGGVFDGGNFAFDSGDHAGAGSPGDGRGDGRSVDVELAIERSAGFGGEGAPLGDGFVPCCACWREAAAFEVGEGSLVGSDHSGAGSGLDAHVADGHAAFHGESADGGPGVFDDVAGGSVGADLADDVEDDVLGGDAEGKVAVDGDAKGLWLGLREGLGGHDVLNLSGADAEGQCPEGSVGAGVGVAADDGHAGLGGSELGADHVDDALRGVLHVEELDAELGAVLAQGVDLIGGDLVDDVKAVFGAGGGDVVIDRGDMTVGTTQLAASHTKTDEGLRRGDLVDEVKIDVEDRRFAFRFDDDVLLPDFFKQSFRCCAHGCAFCSVCGLVNVFAPMVAGVIWCGVPSGSTRIALVIC